MRQYDIIADKIEEVVGNVFHTVQTEYSKLFEYSLLFDPNKHHTWFIILFSPTVTDFKKALGDGTCYLLYSYLIERFSNDELLRNLDIFTSFEIGNRPTTTEDYENLFITHSNKLDRLRSCKELSNETNCLDCGHDFNEHQIMTFRDNESEAPKEGWIICPVDSCTCFKTWSANYSG